MKRPALWLNLFLIAGMTAGQYAGSSAGIAAFFALVVLASYILFKLFHRTEAFIFIAAAAVGFFMMKAAFLPEDTTAQKFAENKTKLEITGFVRNISPRDDGSTIVILDATSLNGDTAEASITDIALKVIYYGTDELVPGDEIKFKSKLYIPKTPQKDTDFNEMIYMRARRQEYRAYASVLDKTGRSGNGIIYTIERLRVKFADIYNQILPEREAGVVLAMVTGNKSYMDSRITDIYRSAGISHILAISGLHISILSLAVFFLLKNIFKIRTRISAITVLIFLVFFVSFSGGSPSVLRAAIMTGTALFGLLIFREGEGINTVSFAMTVMLLFEPLFLFDASFQLSFAATIGIIVSLYVFENKYMASIMAFTATCPIVAWYYGTVPVAGLAVNFIILPFMGAVLILGMLSGILGLLSIPAAKLMSGPLYLILKYYEIICTYADKLDFLKIKTGRPNITLIFLFYLILLLLLYIFKKYKTKYIFKKLPEVF